jgi:membrane-associated phospholipid phosphatase
MYRRWRRILGFTTATAVAIFALYPTAPPRLTPGTGLQDTLATVGGLWSYNHGVVEHITDPYAAMPSLHLGWSTWVALTLASTVGADWACWKRWLFALYPAAVAVIVVATGTHWFLDTIAGSAVAVGVWAADRSAPRVWAEIKARLRTAVIVQPSITIDLRDDPYGARVLRRNAPESASAD